MKPSVSVRLRSLPVWTVRLSITLAALLLGSGGAAAQAPTLHGVWTQVITPRDCATNQPLPFAPPFRVLLTSHRDGTVTESVGAPSFAAGQRSIGHGNWAHDGGLTFSERTVARILFNGASNAWGTPRDEFVTLTPICSRISSRSSGMASDHTDHHDDRRGPLHKLRGGQFDDIDGRLYRTGCATSVGERFE